VPALTYECPALTYECLALLLALCSRTPANH
jgi:hypothetical protein